MHGTIDQDSFHALIDAVPDTLRHAERRLQAFLDYSDEMVALLERDGTFLYASQAITRWLGYAVHSLIGQRALDLVHIDDRPAVDERLVTLARSSEPVVIEARCKHVDGSWRTLRGTFRNLLRDPAIGGIVVNFRDVTSIRETERARDRLEDDVSRIVNSLGIGIWELDLATGRVEWSEETARSVGMTLDEFDGRVETFFSRVHPDDREKLQRASDAALAAGPTFHVEFRVVLPDGSIRWLENNGRVKYGSDGRPTHLGGIGLDITHRKLLEHQLQQAQKLDALGRLAGGVAHDFNNLLQAILGFAEFLSEELEPNDRRQGDVGEITRAAQSATALTKQLLAFSRKQAIEPQAVNLNRTIHQTERMLRRLIGEHIDLTTELDPAVGDIWADAAQIEQILVNLAVNARDAMPDGGRLMIETRTVDLAREYVGFHANVAPGQYVLLLVSDTGLGMTPDVQAKLFEPFFTTKAAGHGTGLGLSTVYGIVRQSGGHVWVYSEPGKGTTFKVYFPRLDRQAAAKPSSASQPENLDGMGCILIVEDNEQVRQVAARTLTRHGYHVLDAATPQAALALAASTETIDLLITDVVLPGMNGEELAEQLRAARPALKCIFMSGYTGDVVAHHLTDAGAAAFLQKPFTARALAKRAKDMLAN